VGVVESAKVLMRSTKNSWRRLRARERRARLQLRSFVLRDKYARQKLEEIDAFKRKFGLVELDPSIYEQPFSNLVKTLKGWGERLSTLRAMEEEIKRRGIKLTPWQQRVLKLLREEVRRNPWIIDGLFGAATFAHVNRDIIAESVPSLENRRERGSWLRYILLRLAPTSRGKKFREIYATARFRKMPFMGSPALATLYDRNKDAARKFVEIMHLLGGPRFGAGRIHPHLEAALTDPRRTADLAELMGAVGETVVRHNYVEEILSRASSNRITRDELRELVENELKAMGTSLSQAVAVNLRGMRYHRRVLRAKELGEAAKRIVEKYLGSTSEQRGSPEDLKKLAAREIALLLMGGNTEERKKHTYNRKGRLSRAKHIRKGREKRKLVEKIVEAGSLRGFFKRMDRRAAGADKGRQAFEEAGAFFGRWDSVMDLRKALLKSREEGIRRVAELMWRYGFVMNPSTGKTSGDTELEMLRKMGALRKHNASDILLQRFLRLAKNVPARIPGAQGVPATMIRKQAAMDEILREIDKIGKIENALKEIERKNFE